LSIIGSLCNSTYDTDFNIQICILYLRILLYVFNIFGEWVRTFHQILKGSTEQSYEPLYSLRARWGRAERDK